MRDLGKPGAIVGVNLAPLIWSPSIVMENVSSSK